MAFKFKEKINIEFDGDNYVFDFKGLKHHKVGNMFMWKEKANEKKHKRVRV